MVRARGDADAGAILVLLEQEGRLLERAMDLHGNDVLIPTGPAATSGDSPDDYWMKRRARDPDLWVVALDVPDGERFAAETILGN